MINENDWIRLDSGMQLNPIKDIEHDDNENGILFLAYYYLQKRDKGLLTEQDEIMFANIVERIQVPDYKGLYHRRNDDTPQQEQRTISHDNLTAISIMSRLFNLPYAKHIASHGLKNFMRFDNAFPEKPRWSRIQHPRDFFTWFHSANFKMLALLFFPIFFISNIITCFTPYEETSGKLLAWLRCKGMSEYSILARINLFVIEKLLKRKYGEDYLKALMEIYFRNERHPNRLI